MTPIAPTSADGSARIPSVAAATMYPPDAPRPPMNATTGFAARGRAPALRCGPMRSVWLAACLVLLACGLNGCARAAQLIPGHDTRPTPKAVVGAPTAVVAPPLLAPGSLRLAGSAGAGGNRPAIPDAELSKAVV